jgi:hypothetical protein
MLTFMKVGMGVGPGVIVRDWSEVSHRTQIVSTNTVKIAPTVAHHRIGRPLRATVAGVRLFCFSAAGSGPCKVAIRRPARRLFERA